MVPKLGLWDAYWGENRGNIDVRRDPRKHRVLRALPHENSGFGVSDFYDFLLFLMLFGMENSAEIQ